MRGIHNPHIFFDFYQFNSPCEDFRIGDLESILRNNFDSFFYRLPIQFGGRIEEEAKAMKILYKNLLIRYLDSKIIYYTFGKQCVNTLSQYSFNILGRATYPDGCIFNPAINYFETSLEHKHRKATKRAYGQILYYTLMTAIYNSLTHNCNIETFGFLVVGGYVIFGIKALCENKRCIFDCRGNFHNFNVKKIEDNNRFLKDTFIEVRFWLDISEIAEIFVSRKRESECTYPRTLHEIHKLKECQQYGNKAVYAALTGILRENIKN